MCAKTYLMRTYTWTQNRATWSISLQEDTTTSQEDTTSSTVLKLETGEDGTNHGKNRNKETILNGSGYYVMPDNKGGLRNGEGILQDSLRWKWRNQSIKNWESPPKRPHSPGTGWKIRKEINEKDESPWYDSNQWRTERTSKSVEEEITKNWQKVTTKIPVTGIRVTDGVMRVVFLASFTHLELVTGTCWRWCQSIQ